MNTVLAISCGASLGALLRFAFTQFFLLMAPAYPFGTTTSNLVGCFIIGYITPMMNDWPPVVRFGIVTGFLGGLTTMSSFAAEVMLLLDTKRWAEAATHWFVGAFVCLAICFLGFWCRQRWQ